MRYASESKNRRWGLPIGLALILIIAVMATVGAPDTASAATPDQSCGWCHGVFTNSSTTGTDTTKRISGVSLTEDTKTPQPDNIAPAIGRGLHGVHMNYSSASYGKWNRYSNSYTSTKGACEYCHNKDTHENGFVEFSGVSVTTPTQKAVSAGLSVSGTGFGSNGLDISLMNGTATCTSACHKGTSASNPAPWGSYTSVNTKLNCFSCHDDSSNIVSTTLSGDHKNHLLSNCTTPAGVLMGAAGDTGCVNCHPDNTNDWRKLTVDDGSQKAYPHAKDGTNVQSVNADVRNQSTGVTPNNDATQVTCTSACHPRSGTITPQPNWASTVNCNMCHYWEATPLDTHNTGAGALSSGHNWHFKTGFQITCVNCHPDHSSETTQLAAGHARKLPPVSAYAKVPGSMRPSMTFNTTNNTCYNTGADCHGVNTTTPAWTTVANTGCATCHEYPGAGPATSNGGMVPQSDWASTNGHSVRYAVNDTHMTTTNYFNYTSDTFDSVTKNNTNKCGLCHRNVTHRNGSGFAHLSSAAGFTYYTSSGNSRFTFVVNGGSIGVGGAGAGQSDGAYCQNAYCHSGNDTPVWW